MRIQWFGQSAFLLTGDAGRVMIDPFGDVSGLRSRVKFDYPEIVGVEADLLLITHEHADHKRCRGDRRRAAGHPRDRRNLRLTDRAGERRRLRAR